MTHDRGTGKAARSRSGVALDPDVLRRRRRELGLTQEALGALAGITERTVRSAERRRPISIASARLLAAAVALPLPTLLWRSPEELRRRLVAAGCAPGEPPHPWGERPADVERLVSTLVGAERGALAVLSGPTGIGKTALARFVAQALHDAFPGGVAWIHGGRADLEGTPTAQLRLAEAFDFHARLPPVEVVGRQAFDQAFRFHLWSVKRLLVLDDVVRPSDVTSFAGPGDAAWVLVTTMHRTVAQIPADLLLEVGPLPEGVGVELLAEHLGDRRVAGEREAAASLVRLLGGVPRSLQIAGRVLKRDRYTRLADYASALALTPSEPVDLLHDAASPSDASFTSAYAQLAGSLSPEAWRLFGDLSAFDGRPFDASWAAAVSGVEIARVRHHLGELAEFYLLSEVDGAEDAAPTWLALDAQSQRAARWVGGSRAAVAEERLVEATCERAVALSTRATADSLAAFARDLERWRHGIELAVRRVFGDAEIPLAFAPEGLPVVPAGVERGAARLCRLLAALRKPLYLTMPPGAGRWLTAGLAAARAVADDGAYGQLCRLIARWTGLMAPNLEAMVGWYHEAVPALLRSGAVDDAMDARSYAAKIVTVTDSMARGLPMLTEAAEEATRHGASDVFRAALTNAAACVDCVVGAPGRVERAEDAFRRALALDLEGRPGDIVRHMLRLNAATVARIARPAAPPSELGPVVEALRAALPADPLADFLLDATARFASGEGGAPEVDDRTRRLVWLGVPREIAIRRLFQGLQLAMEIPQYLGVAGGDGAPLRLVHPVGVTPLFLGLAVEVEIPLPGLLYPVAPLLELLDQGGVGHLGAFVAQAVGPDNPRMALVERLRQALDEVSAGSDHGFR